MKEQLERKKIKMIQKKKKEMKEGNFENICKKKKSKKMKISE
jgi:hypothetical protein